MSGHVKTVVLHSGQCAASPLPAFCVAGLILICGSLSFAPLVRSGHLALPLALSLFDNSSGVFPVSCISCPVFGSISIFDSCLSVAPVSSPVSNFSVLMSCVPYLGFASGSGKRFVRIRVVRRCV